MRYGELLTVTEHGVQVPLAKLEPLGIYDRSQCFGVWLPNWASAATPIEATAPENLLISPIPDQSWPVLVRVELRLSMASDSLLLAARALMAAGLNLIMYDCTPSGYHHLTWTVIGTNDSLASTFRSGTLADGAALAREEVDKLTERHVRDSDRLKDYASHDLGPKMLAFCQHVRAVVAQEHERAPFLHPAFLDADNPVAGRLMDIRRMPEALREEARAQQTEAVTCRWLLSPAFYWLYSRSRSVERFDYDARMHALRPREAGPFAERLRAQFGPVPHLQTLALFDSEETFVRVLFSSVDAQRSGVQVVIPYVAKMTVDQPSTRGLLQEMLREITQVGIRPLHVSHTTLLHGDSSRITAASAQEESNSIFLVGDRRDLTIEDARVRLQVGLQHPTMRAKVDTERLRVGLLTGRRVFISAKIKGADWKAYKTALVRKAPEAGFGLLISDGTLEPGLATEGSRPQIPPDVERKLFASQAFLQIIPPGFDEKDLTWLHFERGIAIGRDLPSFTCICDAGGRDAVKLWKASAIYPEEYVKTFGLDMESFEEAIGFALTHLGRVVDSRTRHGDFLHSARAPR